MAALIRRLSRTTSTAIIGGHSTLSPIQTPNSITFSLTSYRGIASKLFVGGLSFHTTEKTLSDAFTQYGQVIEAKIVHDRVSERSKGFGFVTYASADEADKALSEMDGKPLDGRVIFVDHAKPKVEFGGGMPIARGPPDSSFLALPLVEVAALKQPKKRDSPLTLHQCGQIRVHLKCGSLMLPPAFIRPAIEPISKCQ